jgi:outer membrane protein OmpA-like peptidoglycan-associated protein
MKARILAVIGIAAGAFAAGPASAQDVCNTVINGFDQTAVSSTGRAVLHAGSAPCPQTAAAPAEPAPEPETITIAGDVAFDFDESTIRPEFHPTLDEIAAVLSENPETTLQVVGHTDSIGSEAYNQRLSEARARAVADYLARRGIAADRLVVGGVGEARPIAPNTSEEGRAQNRRVEITAS